VDEHLTDADAADQKPVALLDELQIEAALVPNRRGQLYALAAAEIQRLRAEVAKGERRAVAFGDIVHSQVIAMRAAVVAAKLEGLDVGMQWIANTLAGPGHLPDLDKARALGGAQALWDKETAEHEAFRAAHPAP
jgi:hypothetical protein